MVRPQPWRLDAGEGARSKIWKGMFCLRRDWARVRPVIPAPIMRMGGGDGILGGAGFEEGSGAAL